jgi:hypothetical protein
MPTTVTEETRSPKELLYIEISKDSEKYSIYLKSSEIVKITKNLFRNTVNVGGHTVYWDENIARKILRKIYGRVGGESRRYWSDFRSSCFQ